MRTQEENRRHGRSRLVVTRRNGESIVVNPGSPDEILITVSDIDRGKCRVAVEAPRDLPIHRLEIVGKIADGIEAARAAQDEERLLSRPVMGEEL